MALTFRIQSLWKFYQRAKTRYDVHSPYLSVLVEKVIRNQQGLPIFDKIEEQRSSFLRDETTIEKQSLGAGSQSLKKLEVKVSQVAKTSLAPPWQGRLFHHLVKVQKPAKILELGTCLGISTAYLFSGAPDSSMVSVEGDTNLVPLAKKTIQNLFPNNRPRIVTGSFSECLAPALHDLRDVDLVLMDGDHRYDSTMAYYNMIKPHLSKDAIIIVHDIHWSKEMYQAWEEMRKDSDVSLSVDLYYLGILCKTPLLSTQQSFSYIPWIYKPWLIGLF